MKMSSGWDILPQTGVKNSDEPGITAGNTQDNAEKHPVKPELVKKPDVVIPPPNASWTTLFNGKDFAGWDSGTIARPNTRGPMGTADWKIDNDTILATGGGERGNGTLTTSKKDFGDFEFRLKTKLGQPSNADLNNDGSGTINFIGRKSAGCGFSSGDWGRWA